MMDYVSQMNEFSNKFSKEYLVYHPNGKGQ
jgi:hypothetical protein